MISVFIVWIKTTVGGIPDDSLYTEIKDGRARKSASSQTLAAAMSGFQISTRESPEEEQTEEAKLNIFHRMVTAAPEMKPR